MAEELKDSQHAKEEGVADLVRAAHVGLLATLVREEVYERQEKGCQKTR